MFIKIFDGIYLISKSINIDYIFSIYNCFIKILF